MCQIMECSQHLASQGGKDVSIRKTAGEKPQGTEIENDFRQEEPLPAWIVSCKDQGRKFHLGATLCLDLFIPLINTEYYFEQAHSKVPRDSLHQSEHVQVCM